MKPEFNPDGSIKVPQGAKKLTEEEKILRLLDELNFSLGKRLIAEVIKGENSAKIRKLGLNKLRYYGCLELYDFPDIYRLLDKMLFKGQIKVEKSRRTGYLPVIVKGEEVDVAEASLSPTFSSVTEKDREVFRVLGSFLDGFNDEQKKSIVEPAKRLLSIAGAGSGKTTVLTKRIEFLVKYKNVYSPNILAITFTRKARQEMMSRLDFMMPGHRVKVETFNSFCEKVLQQNEESIYDKPYRVMEFRDKVESVQYALSELGLSTREILARYYNKKKLIQTEQRKLFFEFINDIFSVIENCKNNNRKISEIRQSVNRLEHKDKNAGLLFYSIIENVEKYKQEKGLRDYTDQLLEGLRFIEKYPYKAYFEHILVDEFQDVNEVQFRLLKAMNPENMFAVGDPRQSIYGWRGSKVDYIMNFENHFREAKVIQLSTNYRSDKRIVNAGNRLIKPMNLPPLESVKKDGEDIVLINNSSEEAEAFFIAQSIVSQNLPRKDIFVLVRTNKQAEYLAEVLQGHNIKVLKRTVEEQKPEATRDEVTISTVHAIKGLEAELVYLAGVNSNSFPCLVSDKPIIDQLKLDNGYDKYMEELRLLYVAMTRAKKRLVVSYYNTCSPFITQDVSKCMNSLSNGCLDPEEKLRQWRVQKSRELKVPSFYIFSDKALFQLMTLRPKSYGELLCVEGIGKEKVERFGEELIELVSRM
ncbi:MAG: UvrD-helicase domain-containing protein [Candidatus Nanoarchaeia archaeon]